MEILEKYYCCQCDRSIESLSSVKSSWYTCDYEEGNHRFVYNCKYFLPHRYFERPYCVYMHETPDGKRYIGRTVDTKHRWGHGTPYKTNREFYKAIQKYGWNNIKHEILVDHLLYGEAIGLERYYINLYKTKDPNFGYNKL